LIKENEAKPRKFGFRSGLKRLLTAKEAAEYLGISTKTLWEWTEKGILPRVEIPGTKSKYDLQDLENLIQKNKIYVTKAASEVAISDEPVLFRV
jgi:excisionase family DNA binding protein